MANTLEETFLRRRPVEKEVMEALKLSVKDQMKAFASMRKEGIYQKNVLLAEKRE